MEKQLNWQQIKNYLIIALVLGIILFFLYECHRDIKQGDIRDIKKDYQYKTNVAYKDKYFKLKDSLKHLKPIPPIFVDNWLTPEPSIIDSLSIYKEYLKLYPRGKEVVLVKSDFVLNYPKAPKLLSFDLVKDSISLGLYNSDNTLQTITYPIYLDSYGYRYEDNALNMYNIESKAPTIIKPRLRWDNLYVNGGYDIYNKAAITGLEYNLTPGRFKLDVNAEVLILEQPKLNLNAKVGYRLFK